jgi:hypothetical protein
VAEIDQRLLRNLPPTEVLVAKGEAVRGLSGEAGGPPKERITIGGLTVELPAPDRQPPSSAADADTSDGAGA